MCRWHKRGNPGDYYTSEAGLFATGLLHFRSSMSGVQPNLRGRDSRVMDMYGYFWICILWNTAIWNGLVAIHSEKASCHTSVIVSVHLFTCFEK